MILAAQRRASAPPTLVLCRCRLPVKAIYQTQSGLREYPALVTLAMPCRPGSNAQSSPPGLTFGLRTMFRGAVILGLASSARA